MIALSGPLERLWNYGLGRAFFALSVCFGIFLQIVGAFFYPAGDSGNEEHGLWTIARSSPVLALIHGPQIPHFLYLIAPHLAVTRPLTAEETSAAYALTTSGSRSWEAGSRRHIQLRVTNAGRSAWSSVGGFFGHGAVRLRVTWEQAGRPPGGEQYNWLAWRLTPGDSIIRNIEVTAPPTPGPAVLVVDLLQVGMAPFASFGHSPLRESFEITNR